MVTLCLKRVRDVGVARRSLYYTPSLMPQSADSNPRDPGTAAGKRTTPAEGSDAAEAVNVHYDTRLPQLKWSRRIQIPIIAAAVYSVIRTLGPTLRYEVLGWQHA